MNNKNENTQKNGDKGKLLKDNEHVKNVLNPITPSKPKSKKGTKKCSKCKRSFPATSKFFHRNRAQKTGFDLWCKECKREYYRNHYKRKQYGIEDVEYVKMIEKQNQACAICGLPFSETIYGKKINIDHDHDTGEIRAILCWSCNVLLGFANENPFILIKAVNYLREHKKKDEIDP